MKIRAVHWAKGVNAGDKVQIKDRDGNIRYEAVAAGTNFDQFDLLQQWWEGFSVPVMDSGVLYIELW